MMTEEDLIKQFTTMIERSFPELGRSLRYCHLKVIQFSRSQYCDLTELQIGIYCPESLIAIIKSQKNLLRNVATHLGLDDILCINANRLLRDTASKIKDTHPRLWLELHWILTKERL